MKPNKPVISKHEYAVETVAMADLRALIAKHHYAGGSPNTAIYRHGLIHKHTGRLHGGALWLPPIRPAAKAINPEAPNKVIVLSRLVCTPETPANAASFLIGRSIRRIKADGRFDVLLTYADEGYQGHDGAIYRATNWTYAGKTSKEAQWVDQDGRMVARKKARVTRTAQQMRDLGFTMIGRFAKRRYVIRL